jgi:hypothetical protein
MSDLTLRFRNFYSGFDVANNFFVNCLKSTGLKVNLVTSPFSKVDLQITGPFESKLAKHLVGRFQTADRKNMQNRSFWNAQHQVFYTGENVRPPFDSNYIKTFSFDEDSLNGRNTYFPLWMFEIDWFDTNLRMSRLNRVLKPEILTQARSWPSGKLNDMCAFIGNAEPIRLEAINEFNKYIKVAVYGRFGNKYVKDKLEVSKEFTWNLCFENDLYPGYVTEKILEAYLCGNIPIYRGILPKKSPFNSSSFINVMDFASISESAKFVSKLRESEIIDMFQEPLMKSVPDISQIRLDLLSCLSR